MTYTMLKIKVSAEFFLTFYITHLFLHTGHCQVPGRRFGVSRTRYREQIPVAYRSQQPYIGRQSFARDNYNNRPPVTSFRGYLNNHSRFRNRQNVRGLATHGQTRRYGTASRDSQNSVSPVRYNHLHDRNRYSAVTNRYEGMYDHIPNVVPLARTNERFRYSSRRSVNSQMNSPESRRQFSPYNRGIALNDRSTSRDGTISQGRSSVYRPTYNSPTATFPTDRSHDTSNGNQFSDRFKFPRRVQSAADGIRNYSPMSKNRDNLIQHRLTTSRVANRPRLPAERNEVYQYRTSVMRAPQSEFSVSKNYVDRQRITDNPVQSESLPFEPLSLRYQGFRNSKRVGQQGGTVPDRASHLNTRDTGRSLDTGTRQPETNFGRTSGAQLTDRSARFNYGYTNGDMNRVSFQPVVGSVQRQRFPQRTTQFPQRNTNYGSRDIGGRIIGNDRRFELSLQARGRYNPNRSTIIADRNTARLHNTGTFSPSSHSVRMNIGATSFNQRPARPIPFNRNIQPTIGFQRGLGQTTQHTTGLQRAQTRLSNNDLRLRISQQNGNGRRFPQNNAYTNNNARDESLREILGISRAGLENALKRDLAPVEQSVQGRNNNPISSNVNLVVTSGNRQQRQHSGVSTIDLGKDTDKDDIAEQRADLIANIRRSMDIADQMNLIRNIHVSDEEQTNKFLLPQVSSDNANKERVTILTIRPSNNNGQSRNIIILRHNPREEVVDKDDDDIEDGFIRGLSLSDDESPSGNQISNLRHSVIENDEENERNEDNDHS